jgi:uncharacterized membrane protein YedE/YeeE
MLLTGILFGAGLAMSGMTDTAKVLGFLDIFGTWIPDLAFVMGSAVAFTLLAFRFILKRNSPFLSSDFSLPTNLIVDRRLIGGGVLFGIGWGVYGYCPGPALAAIVYLQPVTMIFILAMAIGMAIVHIFESSSLESTLNSESGN